MIFFLGNSKKRKLKKKLKQKHKEAFNRRMHMIIEARKKHMKNKKDAEKFLSMGGYTSVKSMEQESLGFAAAMTVEKGIQAGAKAIDKLKARKKSLGKSKKTHLAKLKASREKLVARSRT